MEKMKMHTPNLADENFARLVALFPNAVTETTDADGKVIRAIDKDVLMQEINCHVVDGKEERYQFTWPDKKRSVLLANAPSTNTLRPCMEESVGRGGEPGGFDSENLYIEGDNLEVLKLLKETYLHKIKMIYIDPPYNTGNDFVYEDDFRVSSSEFRDRSGDFDESGNRLVKNLDSNGRFHTDWLNMIYPRLRLAKDLLTDDGVIFISIDDNEVENLKKVCDEVFGEGNFVECLKWKRKKQPSFLSKHTAKIMEYILVYAKNEDFLGKLSIDGTSDSTKKVVNLTNKYVTRHFDSGVRVKIGNSGIIKKGKYQIKSMTIEYLNDVLYENGRTVNNVDVNAQFSVSQELIDFFIKNDLLFITINKGLRRDVSEEEVGKEKSITDLLLDWGDNQDSDTEMKNLFGKSYFDYTKPSKLIYNLVKSCSSKLTTQNSELKSQNSELSTKNSQLSTLNSPLILDFFSGSATTAHAVMQLNAEDGGNRKFIMVQLPEKCDESSEAFKAGYKNICEIGKERIRRAGKLIIENGKLKDKSPSQNDLFSKDNSQLSIINSQLSSDIGFRVLKLDSSNMQEVYYTPEATSQQMLSGMVDNIKPDRTDMDLLFQVILEYGLPLSLPYFSKKIEGCTVHYYGYFENSQLFLAACFDKAVNDAVVTEIAKAKPQYVALRDMDSDATLTNFEQIFNAISPETVCKVV